VIEGAAIAAFAIGAGEVIIAVRSDATTAISRLGSAIGSATEAGFIGFDILGSAMDITVTVRPVQGAYMLGEETVLLKALEGKRGQPEQRPPHPAERGLFGMPTVVHNVQTLAALPWIIRHGADAFAAIGAADSPGTILVALRTPGGDGIAEVPLGTPLREVVALAGKLPVGRTIKAILVGGPSGGLLPPDLLDTPYAYASLREVGAHIGSGSVVVADDRACVVDLARLLTRFCAGEACGKTIPCRIGTRRLVEIADRVVEGRSRPTDATLLEDLSADIVASALCDHERLTTLPLASGMRYFRSEVDEHILRSACPAGVCHPIAVAAGALR
jgi:NADH:ubiquinone oxidoreductase subunit F (NADH-binding)